jgi:hypothetical protein
MRFMNYLSRIANGCLKPTTLFVGQVAPQSAIQGHFHSSGVGKYTSAGSARQRSIKSADGADYQFRGFNPNTATGRFLLFLAHFCGSVHEIDTKGTRVAGLERGWLKPSSGERKLN